MMEVLIQVDLENLNFFFDYKMQAESDLYFYACLKIEQSVFCTTISVTGETVRFAVT